jgi:sugar phosphate isomerase/epimerase
MKISIFSKHLQWLDYPKLASAAAELGFDGVDLTVRPDGHVLPERVATDLPRATEAIRKAGLEVYMLTTAISDPDHPHTEAILKTAGKLGIPYYRTGWISYEKGLSIPQNLDKIKVRLDKLAAMNKKYDIHGDYQNHSGANFGSSVWDLWLVLKDLDPKWIGSQYDIRHATIEGAQSWPVGLKLIQPYVRTLDIKDFRWMEKDGKVVPESVPLGTGLVEFPKFFGLAKEYNLTGPFSLHLEYPLGGAENGAKELKIPQNQVLEAIRKDLRVLRTMLT